MASTIEAQGTTSTTISLTANSGYTFSNITAFKNGTVLQVNFVLTSDTAITAHSTIIVGKINAPYTPKINAGSVSPSFRGVVATDGTIYLRSFSNVPAGSGETVCFTILI